MSDVLDEKPDAPLLLDVRNGYEWDVGHFRGAQRPVQESFRETVETNVADRSATDPNGSNPGPLAGVDKSKPIMMYCTGGIRCDVYSTVLKEQGYENVFTLEGGVQAYFDEFGNKEDQKWDDQLFVFDSRLAMTPTGLPAAEAGDAAATLECYCCGERKARAPHRNCPNVDCNRLFLVCQGCLTSRGGFCCAECGKASHVRPTLLQPGRYQRYVHYTEGEAMLRAASPPRAQEARTRREGRVARGCRSEASRPASRRARAREGGGEPGRVREERGLGDARRAHAEHRESRGAPGRRRRFGDDEPCGGVRDAARETAGGC
jgi:rhodanese-related sulfurtransferase